MQFVANERATPIRQASTANFLIDSMDRTASSASASDFSINKNQSLFNGFFTRLGVSEMCMNWSIPNISADAGNNIFNWTFNAGVLVYSITIADGNYTVAQLLDQIATQASTVSGGGTWTLSGTYTDERQVNLNCSTDYSVVDTLLAQQLRMNIGAPNNSTQSIRNPLILGYRYIDFVSTQLTYNQQLKDESTTDTVQNVLYRWNFAWDYASPVDAYGFPVYQGYLPFTTRRILPFPKQIRWESNMPIGQITFQVLTPDGNPVPYDTVAGQALEWEMTLLVSEV